MIKKRELGKVRNAVLREIISEIQKEKRKRCSFPFWDNWNNWNDWGNWYNWSNWSNWWN